MVSFNHRSDQVPYQQPFLGINFLLGHLSAAAPKPTLGLCRTSEYLTKLSLFLKLSLAEHLTSLSSIVLLAKHTK